MYLVFKARKCTWSQQGNLYGEVQEQTLRKRRKRLRSKVAHYGRSQDSGSTPSNSAEGQVETGLGLSTWSPLLTLTSTFNGVASADQSALTVKNGNAHIENS